MAYIEKLQGYVTDVPEIWLNRQDGRKFHFNKLSSSNVSPENNFTEVNGGWGLYPIAYLPGQSTLEMTFESAQFDADLFALASNQTFSKGAVKVFETYEVTVSTTNKAVLETPYAVKATGVENGPVVSINGMTSGETAAAGVFVIANSTGGQSGAAYTTELTFAADDGLAGKTIEVYIEREAAQVDNIIVDNAQTFVGECILRWPVYSSGDEDGLSAGGVKGYIYWRFFKCRVTGAPGFDTSYKTAATNSITVGAMDPHRADGGIYQIYYIEK